MKKILFAAILILNGLIFSQTFTEISTIFPAVSESDADWGDYDNDGNLDLIIAGMSDSGRITKLFRNEGGFVFTEITIDLPGVSECSVVWWDFDNDGFLDVLISGDTGSEYITRIYKNNGDGTFSDIDAGLSGTNQGVQLGDYEGDGDLDILTGDRNLYINESGSFVNQLLDISGDYCRWADYDLDGDMDFSCSVRHSEDYADWVESFLYRNNNGYFELVSTLMGQNIIWEDYNDDGYPDLVNQYWYRNNFNYDDIYYSSKLYKNNGGTGYRLIEINDYSFGSAAWGDYNNDGYLDLLINGVYQIGLDENWVMQYLSGNSIYESNSSGTLTKTLDMDGVFRSFSTWADIDNDGDLDLLFSGWNINETDYSNSKIIKQYRNNIDTPNTAPTEPAVLSCNTVNTETIFSWNHSSDNNTPEGGLSYNIYLKDDHGNYIISPMSDETTGFRKIVKKGNAGQKLSFSIKYLPSGTYHWSVQAIDHSFAGSAFAPEQTVVVTGIEENIPLTTELYQNYPNPFNPATEIKFSLAEDSKVNLSVYNTNGQLVHTLLDGKKEKGFHTINFDASELNSGMYLYRLDVNGNAQTRKMIMLK